MAGKAKSKLVRLLEDLDVRDSADTFQDFVPDDGSQQGDDGQTLDDDDDHTTTECSSDEATGDSPGGRNSPKSRRPCHTVPYERYHVMEKRAVTLLAENKGLQALHEHHVKATNLEVAELRGHLRMLVQAS